MQVTCRKCGNYVGTTVVVDFPIDCSPSLLPPAFLSVTTSITPLISTNGTSTIYTINFGLEYGIVIKLFNVNNKSVLLSRNFTGQSFENTVVLNSSGFGIDIFIATIPRNGIQDIYVIKFNVICNGSNGVNVTVSRKFLTEFSLLLEN